MRVVKSTDQFLHSPIHYLIYGHRHPENDTAGDDLSFCPSMTASGRECRASCTPVSTTSIRFAPGVINYHHQLNVANLTTLLP